MLPRDLPLVALRLEAVNPLVELGSRESEGIPKMYFQRSAAPYGLIEWDVLITFVLDPLGGPIFERLRDGDSTAGSYAVIGHVPGGFERPPPR